MAARGHRRAHDNVRDDLAGRLAPLRAMHELAHSVGATERALTAQVNMLGALQSLGRTDEAIDLARSIIVAGLLAGERLGEVLLALSEALASRNRNAESREYARDALRVMRQCNGACEAFTGLATIALAEGRVEDAARVAGYAESILAREGIERGAQLRAIEKVTGRIDARISAVARKKLTDEGARMWSRLLPPAARRFDISWRGGEPVAGDGHRWGSPPSR